MGITSVTPNRGRHSRRVLQRRHRCRDQPHFVSTPSRNTIFGRSAASVKPTLSFMPTSLGAKFRWATAVAASRSIRDQSLYVAKLPGRDVTVVDGLTTSDQPVPVGDAPRHPAFPENNTFLCRNSLAGTVSVITASTSSVFTHVLPSAPSLPAGPELRERRRYRIPVGA